MPPSDIGRLATVSALYAFHPELAGSFNGIGPEQKKATDSDEQP
jgi:hypothetical protein